MKILVHDYAGHAFPVQLSRALAARGHTVMHAFASTLQTPRGELQRRPGDAPTLEFRAVEMGKEYVKYKYSFVRRRQLEVAYGKRAAALVREWRPEVVLSGQAPTEAQEFIFRAAKIIGARFYPWVQDFYSIAVDKLARKKLPVLGAAVGAYYKWLERRQWQGSNGLVVITEDFVPLMVRDFGVDEAKVTTIPNWAPLEELSQRPKHNAWSEAHGLADKFVFFYSGTLGLKHNPAFLLELAKRYRHDDRVRVVVVSEGLGADWLREQTKAESLPNLIQMGFQPFSALPDMLGTGDVLIGVLEEEAGVFSVPSKILSYFCAGRPVLLAAPAANLATRLVQREQAGLVCAPDDLAGFLAAADRLRQEPELAQACGARGRAYAERTFCIDDIAARFETVLGAAAAVPSAVSSSLSSIPSCESCG